MIKHTLKTFIFIFLFLKYKKSLGCPENTQAAHKLASFIKRERGVFLKMCQYLGTNDKHHKIISDLSFQKEELLDLNDIRLIIKKSNIDFTPGEKVGDCIASASIGQVNAIDSNEAKVIKLKFPGLDKQIKHQQTLLRLLPARLIKRKTGINIDDYSLMIKSLLEKECDFNTEIKVHKHVYDTFSKSHHFKIPKIYPNLSCSAFIVSERLYPVSNNVVRENSRKYSENLAFTYLELLNSGYTQGDSNHGNFLFLEEFKIGVIDFGQFYKFSDDFVLALVSLIKKLRSSEDFQDYDYYIAMGFKPEVLQIIRAHLRVLSMILFEPFIINKSFNLASWDYVSKINLILGQKKWLFRSAGGEEFFMVIKSFVGLKNLMIKLGQTVNLYQVFDEIFYSTEPLNLFTQNQGESFTKQASWVEILIKSDQEVEKEFKLSLAEVFKIESYFPEKVKRELEMKGINLSEVCTDILKEGAAPCKLINFEMDDKKYFISLV